MTEESAYPCPVCRTLTTLEHPCPGCGRAPDPNAAAVITLDHRIMDLRVKVDQAKLEFEQLTMRLSEMRREREAFATAVRSAVAKERGTEQLATAGTEATAPVPVPVFAPPPPLPPARPEAAPRTVQNLLFILGGLLLGIAALVFTAVAWDTYGDVGRAVILSLATLAMLAVGPLVLRRGLRATAETFAVLGLFLLLLDGYAAWSVNLGGIKDTWDGTFYAGTVCAITALASYGYARLVKVTGPRFIALLVAQPVLPLYFVESSAKVDEWALVFAGVAAGNALVLWRKPRPPFLAGLGWTLHALAASVAGGLALVEWIGTGSPRTSLIVVAWTLVIALGAWASGNQIHQGIAAGLVVFMAVLAGVRPLLGEIPDETTFVIWSAASALAVLLAWLSVQTRPGSWSSGARWGATLALLAPGSVALAWAATIGALNLVEATPWWKVTEPELLTGTYQWELPVAVVLLIGAGALLAPGMIRKAAVVTALVALALSAPGWPPPALWVAPAADLIVATALIAWALIAPGRVGLIVKGISALGLTVHAILASLSSPMLSMTVMTAVVVLGLAVSTLAPRNALRPGVTIDGRHELAGVSAGVVDLVLPLLGFTAVAAFGGDRVTSWRVLVLLVLAVPLLGTQRGLRGYHAVAGAVVALYPLWPDLPAGEPEAIYAGASVVAMTLVGTRCAWSWMRWAPALPAFVTLLWTSSSWYSVLVKPIGNVEDIWSGAPTAMTATVAHAIALTLLLAPFARTRSVRIIGFAAVVPALVWLAYFEAPWPVIPAVTLLGGLSIVVWSALRGKHVLLGLLGAYLILPGIGGALPYEWSTITALALVTVASTVLAIGAKDAGVRVMGWVFGAATKAALAYAIGAAASLRPEVTAYLVLLAAAIVLIYAYTPWVREARPAVEAAAHGVALVAFLLAAPEPRLQAGVLAIWGVAIGLAALRKQPVARATVAALLEAVAWVVLLNSADVGTLEAYTLPIAVLGLAVGLYAAYRKPGLSSWLAYGPALAAALLPSLGAVLIEPEGVNRRLLLGAGTLIVVIGGAIWRKQAPFILGGIVLLLLALHELALVWQKVPAWVPLSVGGLLLVGVAITYERRLRDLARLRDTVSKMS